jgi:hypothetical protein
VYDFVQETEVILRTENYPAQLLTVDTAIGITDTCSESIGQTIAGIGADKQRLMADFIGIKQRGAFLLQIVGNGTLAATDTTGQPDNPHHVS